MNNITPEAVVIDGTTYVPQGSVPTIDGEHVLVRSRDAGVFAGRLVARTGDEVELANARRIYYWSGAATLSQLAVDGTSKPGECKFPVAVPQITVLGVCEVIPMTRKAVESLNNVPVWSAR